MQPREYQMKETNNSPPHAIRKTEKQTNGQADKQTDRQTDRETDGQKHTACPERATNALSAKDTQGRLERNCRPAEIDRDSRTIDGRYGAVTERAAEGRQTTGDTA